jgi:23S rRNA pseudouridine2605 synthase/16S rRNA pseudouridine516 synthase
LGVRLRASAKVRDEARMARKRTPKWLQAAKQPGFTAGAKPDWVSRVLSRAGALPPAQVEAALAAGRVTVAGRAALKGMVLVRPGDEVRLDGRLVSLEAPTRVLMLHKPAGLVTSIRDEEGQGTVFEHLLARLPTELGRYGWHAVGRLDRNTTGLLLFTNDERFVTFATAPATHLPKRYLATVSGKLDDEKLEPLRRGLVLDDGPARPAAARVRAPNQVELTLTEGRNHQVKRMLGAVGLPVLALHREAVGQLELDLPEGKWRELTAEELRLRLGFNAA